MTNQAPQLQIAPAPFRWLLSISGLLNLDLKPGRIPEEAQGEMINKALADLRGALSDARAPRAGRASLKGDSPSQGCFTIERGVLAYWRVFIRSRDQGGDEGRFGENGIVFAVDANGGVYWAEDNAQEALLVLGEIFQASDLTLRGSCR